MRQIKRTLERVELTLRIYKDRPIDAALLVLLAFHNASLNLKKSDWFGMARVALDPLSFKGRLEEQRAFTNPVPANEIDYSSTKSFFTSHPEFLTITDKDGRSIFIYGSKDNKDMTNKMRDLAPHYIPDHQAMLDAVHKLQVDP